MEDILVKKPYWKVDVSKTVTYDSIVYIRGWNTPSKQDIIDAINETMSSCDWNETDEEEYDWSSINCCEEKEAVKYDVYDIDPNSPETKYQAVYDENQYLFDFMKT